MTNLKIWCLLIDHEKKAAFGDVFDVEVHSDVCIYDLTEKVMEKRTKVLEHVDAAMLIVWRITDSDIDFGDMDPDTLNDRLSEFFSPKEAKVKKLSPKQGVRQLTEKTLLIEVPGLNELRQIVSAKRMLDEEDLSVQIERFKKQRITETAPSTLAAQYSTIQKDPQERILDDIPTPDTDVPPVSLLFDGFGEFLDTFRTYDGLPVNVASMTRAHCHSLIDKFAEKMCQTYPDDDRRNKAGVQAINNIFAAYGINNATFQRAVIEKVISDGHFLTERNTVGGVVAVKNNGSGTGGIHIRMAGYAARGRAEALGGPNKELILWRAPCMGISVVDTRVGFYAILFLGSRTRAVSLTPWLSCSSGGEEDQRSALYAAFAAATVLIRRITQDASMPDVNRHADLRFPYISHLPTEGSSSNESFSFRIVCRFGLWRDSRLLFKAQTNDGREIIVKFSRQYSIDLHRFCVVRGHAPKLLGHKKLPGGWFAVAMDLIDPMQYLAEAEITQEKRDS